MQISKALEKLNVSTFERSGVSSDILIKVATFLVLSRALILFLIRLCLLNPLSQPVVDTGIVKARMINMMVVAALLSLFAKCLS